MMAIRYAILKELKRKNFDLDNWQNWKGLHNFDSAFCGAIILKYVLRKDVYKHFLILCVACRILCNHNDAIRYVDYANILLRSFLLRWKSYMELTVK